jgi:hypothetical protein
MSKRMESELGINGSRHVATGKLRLGGSRFQAILGKYFARLISKITRAEWTDWRCGLSGKAPAL